MRKVLFKSKKKINKKPHSNQLPLIEKQLEMQLKICNLLILLENYSGWSAVPDDDSLGLIACQVQTCLDEAATK